MSSILASRERRWREKHALARRWRACVLSLCLNIPGPDKNPPGAERAFALLQAALRAAHAREFWRWHDKRAASRKASLYEVRGAGADGPYWLLLSRLPGFTLKRMAVRLERAHPLGRLADIDVLTRAGKPVSRADLGLPPRACFLCGEPAVLCRRSRRHSQEMLMAFVTTLLKKAGEPMSTPCEPKNPHVIVLGITQDHAFAAGCALQAIRRHSPAFAADILIYHDGGLFPKDAEILTELGATLVAYTAPAYAFRAEVIQTFSLLTLARFECFRLLRRYETAIWLDVDIAVQRDISGLTSFGPFALSLEDPLASLPPYKPSKASINILAPVPELDGDADNYNSGILVLQRALPNPEQLYRLCMQWLEQYAPLLQYPDQAVINMLAQYLARRDPSLVGHIPCDMYNAHPKNPAAWNAAIVHGFSVFKFWSNGLAGCCFPEWERDYRNWIRRGGSAWQGPIENAPCRERGAFPTLHSMMLNVAGMQKQLQGQQTESKTALLRADDAEKRLAEAEKARDDALGEASRMRQELARERALRQALERALQK